MTKKITKIIERGTCFVANEATGESLAFNIESSHKLATVDWKLAYAGGISTGDIFEIRFKNTRKGYYQNSANLILKKGDIVAVEGSPGHDIGIISLTGDLVRKQMRCKRFDPAGVEFKKIYRIARGTDIDKWQEAIAMEHITMIKARRMAEQLRLNMKIGDVEYQGDRGKAIFYYIADARVDFRELIKIFAEEFKVRIEMKQIGARQEAGRIGGIGSCGRELCCSTWVTNFVSVTTNSARFQEISLNPQKLAGQCGKLKCCMNYEVDSYIDARKGLPKINAPLETKDAQYFLIKTDIFKREMIFSSDPHSMANIIAISVDRVWEILHLNRKGTKPDQLRRDGDFEIVEEQPDYKNVVGDDSITRFDKKNGVGDKNNPKRNRKRGDRPDRVERAEPRDNIENRERNTQREPRESGANSGEQREKKERTDNRERGEKREPRQGGEQRERNNQREPREPKSEVATQSGVGKENSSAIPANGQEQRTPNPNRRFNRNRNFNKNKKETPKE